MQLKSPSLVVSFYGLERYEILNKFQKNKTISLNIIKERESLCIKTQQDDEMCIYDRDRDAENVLAEEYNFCKI